MHCSGLQKDTPKPFCLSHVGLTIILSGCINALVTTPLWVVNTRLKLQCTQKTSTSDGTQQKKLDGLFRK